MSNLKAICEQTCAACAGAGVVYRACRVCGARHEFERNTPHQPCGHDWAEYVEEELCPKCGGRGRRDTEFDLSKFIALLDNFVAQTRIFAINKKETESDIDGAAQELLEFLRASASAVTNW